ncbi:MAG: glucoamylase family protein [Ignavibacteriales bacterium]
MRKILGLLALILGLSLQTSAQDYVFFSDSPDPVFYDWSWSFISGTSTVERKGEKAPVDTAYHYSGTNSLRMHWTSKAGGDWGLAIAEMGTPWPVHDITKKDSLSFWVYSTAAIAKADLPLMYLEDNTNKKSSRVMLSTAGVDIPANKWTKLQVALSLFTPGPQGADLTIIKTLFFGQDAADNAEHYLYLDEIRMISSGSSTDTIPPGVPANLTAKGYDSHIDLIWNPNTESDLAGYRVYKQDAGTFKLIATVTKDDHVFTDFLGAPGMSGTYKISAIDGKGNESAQSSQATASTQALNDEQLLTMLQESTFRYFWDYAHPSSGMARERTGSANTVTSGGSGFGIMALLTGIERGFITREQGTARMIKILNFLNSADRFHGAFPHWMNGLTGKVIPFSQYDNGGDLVETAFLMQGLLTARQYFNRNTTDENIIRVLSTALWEGVEWNWYLKDSSSTTLFWHWSPNYAFQINMALVGWNETMITYLLAIASPKHPIPAADYEKGWAGSSSYDNGKTYYGYPLWVGWENFGPLFFAHYSFLGFDPRGIKDKHANYFLNNRNATLINRAYCIDNPKKFTGYDQDTWGITASDDPYGYSAHQPVVTDDNGTLAPTAALSSMPYTPKESIAAFKNFYKKYGAKLYGPYGFKDAFNPQQNWFDNNYIAIDEGPIAVMVENYRSGLLWKNFMANPEIAPMLAAIGFVKDTTTVGVKDEKLTAYTFELKGNYPNPFNPSTTIEFTLPALQKAEVVVYDMLGRKIRTLAEGSMKAGLNRVSWNGTDENNRAVSSGIYLYTIRTNNSRLSGKMMLIK